MLAAYLYLDGIVTGCLCFMVLLETRLLFNSCGQYYILWFLIWSLVCNSLLNFKSLKYDGNYFNGNSWKFLLFCISVMTPLSLLLVYTRIGMLILLIFVAFVSKSCKKFVALRTESRLDNLTNLEYVNYILGMLMSSLLTRTIALGFIGQLIIAIVHTLLMFIIIYLDGLDILLDIDSTWVRYSPFRSLGCHSISVFVGNFANYLLTNYETVMNVLTQRMSFVSQRAMSSLDIDSSVKVTPVSVDIIVHQNKVVFPPDMPSDNLKTESKQNEIEEITIPGRYMRGCNNNIEEATRRYHHTMNWRRENNIDRILSRIPKTISVLKQIHLLKECYPHYFHGCTSKAPRTAVYYERLGMIDINKLDSYKISIESLLYYNIFLQEYIWNVLDPNDDSKLITVLDVSNIKMSDMMGSTLEYIKKSIQVIQAHYIDRCFKMYIINAPFYFNMLWRIISPLLNETTRGKVSIIGSSASDIVNALSEHIALEDIPVEYQSRNASNCLSLGQHINELNYRAFIEQLLDDPKDTCANVTDNTVNEGDNPQQNALVEVNTNDGLNVVSNVSTENKDETIEVSEYIESSKTVVANTITQWYDVLSQRSMNTWITLVTDTSINVVQNANEYWNNSIATVLESPDNKNSPNLPNRIRSSVKNTIKQAYLGELLLDESYFA